MGAALEHRHGRQVQRVPVGRLECLDPPLAQDDRRVPLAEDVFRAHEKFVQRRRHAALEQHRPAGLPDLPQQTEILHVPRTHLEHVGVGGHKRHLVGRHHLGDHGQAGGIARLPEQPQPRFAQPLEGIG